MKKEAVIDLGKTRISGNHSIVWGGLEAGVRVTTAYPGAPISELQGTYEQLAGNLRRDNVFSQKVGEALDKAGYQLSAHWGQTTNEPNAVGMALGATICKGDSKEREFLTEEERNLVWGETVFGKDDKKRIPVGSRVMTSFKHLGGNTAADALRTAMNVIPYVGGLGIASGDDRQATSSQTQQDNKVLFAMHYRMPVFELHSPVVAHRTVRNCYRLFEELGTPFGVIMNYNLAYREVTVELTMNLDLEANGRQKSFKKDPQFLVTIGPHIRPREAKWLARLLPMIRKKIKENYEFLGSEVVQYGSKPKTMLVVLGPFREDFKMVRHDEALRRRLESKFGDVVAVAGDLVFPQPEELYTELISKHPIERILVFEEGYTRVVYLQLLDMVNRLGLNVKVLDRTIPYEPRIYDRFSYIDHILAA